MGQILLHFFFSIFFFLFLRVAISQEPGSEDLGTREARSHLDRALGLGLASSFLTQASSFLTRVAGASVSPWPPFES